MQYVNTWNKAFTVPPCLNPLAKLVCLRNSNSVEAKLLEAFTHLQDLDFTITALDNDYIEGQLYDVILSITLSEEQVVINTNVKQTESMITIEGNVGIGKSTLAKTLSEKGFGTLQLEEVNLKLLLQFYSNPTQYGFTFQLYMLAGRLAQSKNVRYNTVIDRGILGDSVFAKVANANGVISDVDYDTYLDILKADRRHPDMITLYLTARPEICLSRLQTRNRESESGIELAYLETIDRAHFEAVISGMLYGDITVIADWSEFGNIHAVSIQLIKTSLTGIGDEQYVTLNYGTPIDWSEEHDLQFRENVWRLVMAKEHIQLQNYSK